MKSTSRFFLLAVALSSLTFVSCTFNRSGKVKIGFILSNTIEERYQKDQKYFIEEAERLGFEPLIASAENNPLIQSSKVENLLALGARALVIQPVNFRTAASFVALAHDDKIPVIAYDRLIAEAPVDFYVTQDSFHVGVLQAEAAVKATGGKGNYIILRGQAGHSVAGEITAGVHSVFDKYPEIKVVVEQDHENWSSQLAMTTVENALTRFQNKIDAILSNNSTMANGAIQALTAQNLTGHVFVAGADADLASIKNIVAGKQQFEVLKDIAPLARKAAQVAFDLARGIKPTPDSILTRGSFHIPIANTPVYAVTKDNLEERIFKSGFHSKIAVYGH